MSKSQTRVIIQEAILSYPHLLVPQAGENGGKPKYSTALILLPGSDVSALEAAAIAAAEEKFGASINVNGKTFTAAQALEKGIIRSPFRRDVEAKGYPEGSMFMNVRTENKPVVVHPYPDVSTGKPKVMTDEEIKAEMYPGAVVRVSVTAFGYIHKVNKGVSFALNGLQKLRDGDRLDNRVAAVDEFDAVLSEAPANLEDLIG